MAVEVALVRVRVGRPGGAVGQRDDRVEVVLGHQVVDRVLHRRGDVGADVGAVRVTSVGRLGELENEVVPGALEQEVLLVERDQLGEGLRVRLVRQRVRAAGVRLEVRGDVRLELAQERSELARGRGQVDVGPVDDGRTLGLERVDHVVEDRLDDRAHQRRVVGSGAPDADAGALEGLVVEERGVVGGRVADLSGGRGVLGVDPGRCAEEHRCVGHVAGHRAGRVLVGADRDDTGAAPQPECRLDPDDAVGAGRADDRAVRLGADGRDREIGSRDDAGAGARAAWVAIEDVGHVRLAPDAAPAARRRAGTEIGPLGQVGLADDDRAGGLQPRRDERVAGRAPGECPGAGCRRHPGGVDVVLDDDRNPEQRTLVAVAPRPVGRSCVGKGGGADRDHRIERRFEQADAPEIEVRQHDGVEPARVHQRLELRDRRRVDVDTGDLRVRRVAREGDRRRRRRRAGYPEHKGHQGRHEKGTPKSAAHRVTSTGIGWGGRCDRRPGPRSVAESITARSRGLRT